MAIQNVLNPSANDADGELSSEATKMMCSASVRPGESITCPERDQVRDSGPTSIRLCTAVTKNGANADCRMNSAPEVILATVRTDSDLDSPAPFWTSPGLGVQWSANTTPDPAPLGNTYRAPYTTEQIDWIWFHTTDVPHSRKGEVDDSLQRKYNAQWPGRNRKLGGILCKLYRLMEEEGLPKRRAQKGPGGHIDPLRFGVWANKRHRYRWMDEFAHELPGKSVIPKELCFVSDPITGYVPGRPYCQENCRMNHPGSLLEH